MENGQILEMARLSRIGTAPIMEVDMEIAMAGHRNYMLGTGTGAYANSQNLIDHTSAHVPYVGLSDKALLRKIKKQDF